MNPLFQVTGWVGQVCVFLGLAILFHLMQKPMWKLSGKMMKWGKTWSIPIPVIRFKEN